jgi:hypothetical protein
MARDDPKFVLRLPADLKARVEAAAKANGRSINAEIVNTLLDEYADASERPQGNSPAVDVIELVMELLYDQQTMFFDAIEEARKANDGKIPDSLLAMTPVVRSYAERIREARTRMKEVSSRRNKE